MKKDKRSNEWRVIVTRERRNDKNRDRKKRNRVKTTLKELKNVKPRVQPREKYPPHIFEYPVGISER